MRGKFITFEGTEGVGKSTQVRLLGEYLEKTNQKFLITREPGGDAVAEKIRRIVLDAENDSMTYETEALLYAASRAQHVKNVILPALDQGINVFCDRFVDSSLAYQAYGRQLPLEFVKNINAYALKNCPPDLTILLEIDFDEAFKRKGGADKSDRIEISGDAFFERVNSAYNLLQRDNPVMVSIDPSGTKYETHQKIVDLLKERGIIY